MDKALILNNVSFSEGNKQYFRNLNLEINRGEIVAFCGMPSENIGRIEDLLLRKTGFDGSVILDGAETERLSEEALRFLRMVNIGVLPKTANVGTLRMTVHAYIMLPFRESIKKTEREIILDAKRVMELLGVQNTEGIMRKKMHKLSEEELRAVLYAAALATDPAVAVLNADFKMDSDKKDSFYTVLIKVCKIKNIALLLLTNDILFAKKYGEKTYIIRRGEMVPLEGENDFIDLENAARMAPIAKNEIGNEDVIRISHMKASTRDEKLDFTLYKKEIVSLSCEKGPALFLGRKKPSHGHIYADNIALPRNKSFQKCIMHISEAFPIIPSETIGTMLSAFSKRPSLRDDMGRILDFLPIPTDLTGMPPKPETLFHTLYLGLLCAAMSEAKLILLSDIDNLSSTAEKYEILTLLSAICDRTSAGAIVFSDDDDVHRAVNSKLYEMPKERTDAYADAT